MPKFHVYVPEVHYQTVEIEAADFDAAVKAVNDGNGEPLDDTLEYSHVDDATTSRRVKNVATGEERECDPYCTAGDLDEEEG